MWKVVEPATTFLDNWHIDAMCESLECVSRGEIHRLIINVPPRMMKSSVISLAWPTWEWTFKPWMRYIFSSYSGSLSENLSVKRRNIVKSPWYQEQWGERVSINKDMDHREEFQNSYMGHMIATSIGGTVTGKGGDRIVIDDPHNPKEAQSDIQRQQGIDFYRETLYSRLDDKKNGAIVLIMQRLHEDDLTGHILNSFKEDGWVHLCMPGECETESEKVISIPNGKKYKREIGDLLWPEREGEKEILAMKNVLGSYGYAAQYGQKPAPKGGGMVQDSWWRYYRRFDLNDLRFVQMCQSWDMTFKDTDGTDYVVGQVWGRTRAEYYLLDMVRARMDFPKTIQAVRTMTAKWPKVKLKLVEDKANGSAIIAQLHKEIPGMVAVQPEGGKMARLNAVAPFIESGNVYLPMPDEAPWVNDLLIECAQFPNGKKDDTVDAMSQALFRLSGGKKRHFGLV
jgi:predicted phage terminase large subunit-like protein